MTEFVERVTRRNKGNECKLPLTISAQYGLVDQITFFNKIIASADMSNYYLLTNGDFAYNKSYSSEYPWGAIKRLDRYEYGALSSLYICFRPLNHVSSDFLTHYFETKKWHQGISEIAVEGARNHGLLNIGIQDFFATKHYLPQSILEQEKIACFLNLIEERIRLQNKIIEKLQSLIKGIIVSHYSTTAHTIKVKIRELGEAYSTMVMSKEQLTNDGNLCVFYGELFTLYGCVIDKVKSRTSLEIVSSTLSHGRDLLFPASTTVDAVSLIAPSALMQKGIILGGDMFGIKVSEAYNPIYLSYYFNYIANKRLAKYAKGTTIIHLHYNEIANVAIELPNIEEQDKIVSTILEYSAKLSIEETKLEKLFDLKQYLLKQLFI